jgi:hypothetical protein
VFVVAFRGLARVWAAYLGWGPGRATTYVRGSLNGPDFMPGLSDVDLALVLPHEPGRRRARRARSRWLRLRRRLPWTGLILDYPRIYDEEELRDLAGSTALTYGLDGPDDYRAAYLGAEPSPDCIRTLERPGLYGKTADWRRVSGPDRLPAEVDRDAQRSRVAAWLELSYWWRWAFPACIDPSGPRTPYLCLKLVSEPARVWLWLAHGERASDRRDVLHRALQRLPEEEDALRRALDLCRRLPDSPVAPLGEVLPVLVRLSARVAALIADQIADRGDTQVRLASGDLVLADGTWHDPAPAEGAGDPERVLPLCDWRGLVWPRRPDHAFAPLAGDPGDPAVLARAAAHDSGPHPALFAQSILILPAATRERVRLRALQCPVTDPVSFALAAGDPVARFPNVRGWSVQDTARRAVAEHRAWLRTARPHQGMGAGQSLGCLLTAARAALLLQSVADDDPELALTVTATVRCLAARSAAWEAVGPEALETYRDAVLARRAPAPATVSALRRAVMALPAYADA